jgi:hypothetical protein
MEVLNVLCVVVGGLSLIAAIAEIRNRAILRAERKKAEAERQEAEALEKAKPTAWENAHRMKALYKALDADLKAKARRW